MAEEYKDATFRCEKAPRREAARGGRTEDETADRRAGIDAVERIGQEEAPG
jgi:hypothetical protein